MTNAFTPLESSIASETTEVFDRQPGAQSSDLDDGRDWPKDLLSCQLMRAFSIVRWIMRRRRPASTTCCGERACPFHKGPRCL